MYCKNSMNICPIKITKQITIIMFKNCIIYKNVEFDEPNNSKKSKHKNGMPDASKASQQLYYNRLTELPDYYRQ